MSTNSTTSNYISKINQQYPVAGQDNDSQGFRDNFRNIAQALTSADEDINYLQLNSVKKTETTDFDDNIIKQAVFQDCSLYVFDNSTDAVSGDIVIDYRNGSYQKYKLTAGYHRVSVSNWPGTQKSGKVILAVTTSTSEDTYIDFGATNLVNLGYNPLPVKLRDSFPLFFEMWSGGDDGYLYVKEISEYTTGSQRSNINAIGIVASNITATNSMVIGTNNYTGLSNGATIVRTSSKGGVLATLPDRIIATITTDPVTDFPGDTTATDFAVNSAIGVLAGATVTFSNTGSLFSVVSLTTNTVKVDPWFDVGSFVAGETVTFTNPGFIGLEPLIRLGEGALAPTTTKARKSDLKGHAFVSTSTLWIAYSDFVNTTTDNWFTIDNSISLVAVSTGTSVHPRVTNTIGLGEGDFVWTNVWATNGTIQTSDQRLKTEITDSTLGLGFIKDLRPVSYKFTDNQQFTHWGLIAQEVKSTLDRHNVDFAGWRLADENNDASIQHINYTEFIAPLIQAVKELADENEGLRNEINNIKKHLGL